MNVVARIVKNLAIVILGLLVILSITIYSLTYHPKTIENVGYVCPTDTPSLTSGQSIKVLSYNVQYFAGKDYVFYYDLDNDAGPDTRPSAEAIEKTVTSIAKLILSESPDILLLQELHDGAKATDYKNQTALLMSKLNSNYPCYSEAFYWKADFVPHPAIMGSVGMKLLTLSKYKIDAGTRHQLSLMESDPVTQAFNLKRAILVTEFPMTNNESNNGQITDNKFVAMNTHLDAFSQGMNTMEKQVSEVDKLLSATIHPWIIGGDFNLLPPNQFTSLVKSQQNLYKEESEIAPLTRRYASVPSMPNVNSEDKANWYTHYPNDPGVLGPDRTIDYIFYDRSLTLVDSQVMHGVTHRYSDHLPLVATYQLP